MENPTGGQADRPGEGQAGEEKPGRADDYVDVFIAPSEVYDRRRDGRWGQAFIVLSVVLIALYYAFLPATEIVAEAEMARAAAEDPQAAQAMEQMAGFGRTMRLVGGIFVPIVTLGAVALLGAILWGFGRLLGIGITPKQGLVIATFARFVHIPRTIAMSLSILWADRGGEVVLARDTSFGPARFLDTQAMHDAATPLLTRLDVFVLWEAALWAVGLWVIGRTEKTPAILVAVIALLLAALPGVLWALVQG